MDLALFNQNQIKWINPEEAYNNFHTLLKVKCGLSTDTKWNQRRLLCTHLQIQYTREGDPKLIGLKTAKNILLCVTKWANINVALFIYSRAFGEGLRNFKPWTNGDTLTSTPNGGRLSIDRFNMHQVDFHLDFNPVHSSYEFVTITIELTMATSGHTCPSHHLCSIIHSPDTFHCDRVLLIQASPIVNGCWFSFHHYDCQFGCLRLPEVKQYPMTPCTCHLTSDWSHKT
ncbi:hypothetical protein TNCV_4322781 [Trichonephila clavipes]|nr:hypothetical protein TNCV_4322781 [Trichonephila clavipes]